MFESLKRNYVGALSGMAIAFGIAVLYYITGQLAFIVEPVDIFLSGKYQMVMILFAMAGMTLGSFVKIKGDK